MIFAVIVQQIKGSTISLFRLNKRGDGREHVHVLCKSYTIAGELISGNVLP